MEINVHPKSSILEQFQLAKFLYHKLISIDFLRLVLIGVFRKDLHHQKKWHLVIVVTVTVAVAVWGVTVGIAVAKAMVEIV